VKHKGNTKTVAKKQFGSGSVERAYWFVNGPTRILAISAGVTTFYR
jgi:hypothetical protein